MLLYRLGRALQVIGMILPLIGVAGNVADQNRVPLKMTLILAGVGVAIFAFGWLVQQAGKPPA